MWVEQVLGNVADGLALMPGPADFLDVSWGQCGRMLKSRTRQGHPIRVLLPPGSHMRHGDVLVDNDDRRVIVNVLPCEVIVARPASFGDMTLLCLEMGNLHCPAQITESEVIFIEEGRPLAVLEQLQISWSRECRRFEPIPISASVRRSITENA